MKHFSERWYWPSKSGIVGEWGFPTRKANLLKLWRESSHQLTTFCSRSDGNLQLSSSFVPVPYAVYFCLICDEPLFEAKSSSVFHWTLGKWPDILIFLTYNQVSSHTIQHFLYFSHLKLHYIFSKCRFFSCLMLSEKHCSHIWWREKIYWKTAWFCFYQYSYHIKFIEPK